VKLTKDAVARLELPTDGPERVVWDSDIPGFGVRLRSSGATWFFRYRFGHRQPRMTIGAVNAISAAQARAVASKLYAQVKLGQDPAGDRASALERATETMGLVLRQYLVHKQAELRPGSFGNVDRHLTKHAIPLHRLELAKAADRRTIASLLTKIAEDSGPREANSVKGSLGGFFLWALGQGLLDGNDPTTGIANFPLKGPRTHVPTDADMVKILRALPPGDYGAIVMLLALTLTRRAEMGDLAWSEVDFPAGLIRLPATRTKTGVAREVPMSTPVRRILETRPRGIALWCSALAKEASRGGTGRSETSIKVPASPDGYTMTSADGAAPR
jgi:hypothetical protein